MHSSKLNVQLKGSKRPAKLHFEIVKYKKGITRHSFNKNLLKPNEIRRSGDQENQGSCLKSAIPYHKDKVNCETREPHP